MEYLVTMTTHVPQGTSVAAVDEIRAREAIRAGELACIGNLLRLWRPPLAPGEWRTIGLFAADNETELETVMRSMPLRVWRTDEAIALEPHPNDPQRVVGPDAWNANSQEFLTRFVLSAPGGADLEHERAHEAERARELADEGHLLRLWRSGAPPNGSVTYGLWRARNTDELTSIVDMLPLRPWLAVETTPLAPHPSDPAFQRDSRSAR
jgi:muconolactone delta-isomerase